MQHWKKFQLRPMNGVTVMTDFHPHTLLLPISTNTSKSIIFCRLSNTRQLHGIAYAQRKSPLSIFGLTLTFLYDIVSNIDSICAGSVTEVEMGCEAMRASRARAGCIFSTMNCSSMAHPGSAIPAPIFSIKLAKPSFNQRSLHLCSRWRYMIMKSSYELK